MSTNKLNKASELAGTGPFPANRLNQRERKTLETAEEYTPSVPGNWGSTPPTTQDGALNALAASGVGGQFGMATASAVWDFSVNGGATGTIDLGVALPSRAIIVEVIREVETSTTSTGSTGTIQLNTATGNLEQTAYTANGASVPAVASSGGSAVPLMDTAAQDLRVTIATNPLLTGRIRWFVRYYRGE